MKLKLFFLLMMAGLGGLVSGCYHTVDEHTQFGVPGTHDSVESTYERSLPEVLEAAKAVINYNGKLTGDNTVINSLEGTINQSTVWVRVVEVDPGKPLTRVTVQARHSGASDIELAAEVKTQIALKLAVPDSIQK